MLAGDQLNNLKYYQKFIDKFSFKGTFPAGWEIILETLSTLESKSIIDLGSGDGRFLSYLKMNNFDLNKYKGIDQINYNKLNNQKETYVNSNLLSYALEKKDSANALIILNVLYHFSIETILTIIFPYAVDTIENKGYFIFNTWDFNSIKSLNNKTDHISNYKYKIYNNKSESDHRIVYDHTVDKVENRILIFLKQNGLELITKYSMENTNDASNRYYIYKKK